MSETLLWETQEKEFSSTRINADLAKQKNHFYCMTDWEGYLIMLNLFN